MLSVIGIERLYGDDTTHAGYGASWKPFFWIGTRQAPAGGTHIAFTVADCAAVDRFNAAGIAAGGGDNGAPGLRPHYDQTIMLRSSSIRTGTTSKPFATTQLDGARLPQAYVARTADGCTDALDPGVRACA